MASRRGGARPAVAAAAAVYFAWVFGAGFALGVVRELWLAPRVGARTAQLLETPLMLGVVLIAARASVRRFAVPRRLGARLAVGLLALALLLGAEVALALGLRGLSPAEIVTARDPVAGTVYALALVLFAAMPALVRARP